jgi:hypothetical protein
MSRHLAISPSDGAILLVTVNALVGGSVQENVGLSQVVVPAGTAAEQSLYLGSVAGDVPEVEMKAALLALEEIRHPEVKTAADAQVVADAALVSATANLATAQAKVPVDQPAIDAAQTAYDKALTDKQAADKAFADAKSKADAEDAPPPPAEALDAAVAADQKQLAADQAAAAAEDAAEATPPTAKAAAIAAATARVTAANAALATASAEVPHNQAAIDAAQAEKAAAGQALVNAEAL